MFPSPTGTCTRSCWQPRGRTRSNPMGNMFPMGLATAIDLPPAFRQNITIQFCSNLLPVEREEAGTPLRVYPCPSVAKSLVFFGVRSAFEVWFFGPRMDTDTHG